LNRIGKTKHKPALPLFNQKQAEQALQYFTDVPFEKNIQLFEDIHFEFRYAGHILGAASVVLTVGKKKITFTGDIGRLHDQIFYPPKPLPETDFLITESTYGNRLHKENNILFDLETLIKKAAENKSVIVIPAFAVGRAQAILFYLSQLREQKRIPTIPVYLNSPMAKDCTSLFQKYKELHRLTDLQCAQIYQMTHFVSSVEQSKALNTLSGPMIIISASGMLTGGRVLHHLKAFAPDPKNIILLTGFQSAGTRGEALANGAKEVKIFGEYIPVNAQVKVLDNMSAHADYGEIIKWFKESNIHPKKVFVTHGEPSASDELRRRLEETFSWNCAVPEYGQVELLE